MTVRHWRKAIWVSRLLVLALAAALASDAQGQANQQCDVSLVMRQPGTVPRHPVAFLARVDGDLQAGRYRKVLDRLIADFQGDPALPPGDPRRVALTTRLVTLRDAVGDSVDLALYTASGGRSPNVIIDIVPHPNEDDRFDIFPADDDRIVVTPATPEAERRAICWTAITAQHVVSRVRAPAIDRAVEIMRRTMRQWENYDAHGYSMYPWESFALALPGIRRCVETNLGPPVCAPILLHANAGMEVSRLGAASDAGWNDLRSRGGVLWDVIGMVWYTSDWRGYWGVAAIAFTSSEQSPAIGGAVHIGRGIEIGALFRGNDGTGPRRAAILSVDAYRVVAGLPAKFSAARSKLAEAVDKAGAGAP